MTRPGGAAAPAPNEVTWDKPAIYVGFGERRLQLTAVIPDSVIVASNSARQFHWRDKRHGGMDMINSQLNETLSLAGKVAFDAVSRILTINDLVQHAAAVMEVG